MEEQYGIPFIKISFFGLEDSAHALYEVAEKLGDASVKQRTQALVRDEIKQVLPRIKAFKKDLQGKRAGLYVGGAFKAYSLVRALRQLGVSVVLAGTQTGSQDEYEELQAVCDENTVIVDDTNALELANYLVTEDVDLFIGGVKERPIAYKLGIGFCDHNHERKIPLAGFEGAVAFAKEIHATATSPIWELMPRKRSRRNQSKPQQKACP
jgi:nitrogenase molybdenum-cofactor synthesis protein NifE